MLDLIIFFSFCIAGLFGCISVGNNWHRHAKKMSEEREKYEHKRI
ncbi:TPA: hypothetical protein ACGW48_005378 [Bacillus paranthracis]